MLQINHAEITNRTDNKETYWNIEFSSFVLHNVRFYRPPLWSGGQIFWEGGGLERGPLSLVRTIEELVCLLQVIKTS
jgi:hypothetical protein